MTENGADLPTSRRLPDLQTLELLVAVADTGSIGRAAAQQRITQPAASARLRTLERKLDLLLLDRSRRGSQLTPAGLVVTDWARGVLEQAHVLAESLAALQAQQRGELRLVASLTLAEQLLPGWLISLRQVSPGTHVGLRVTNSHQVIEALRHGEADLGFIEGPFVPRDFRSVPVGRDRLAVVTSPEHPWARRTAPGATPIAEPVPVTGAELAETPLLLREPGSGTRETLERALRPWVGPSVPALELGATAPLRSAAAQGAAPAVLSLLAVADDLAAGRLVEIPVAPDVVLSRVLRAVWPSGGELPAPARLLLDLIRRGRQGGQQAGQQAGEQTGEQGSGAR
ncbi:LysR substrate-binding domain-containing protein [Streptacidiphilus fuscans]|uniref:LysR substrate-binding domain-containing protein n=1 Tax=Streptacidiphilus fuscans TaxID=2789292 RepID=UPI002E2BB7A2|nr:LysR substrate-binding domain-containing protein [Streptacidiphilus fuscans]